MSICKDGAFTLNQHSIDTTTGQADYQLYDTSFYLKAVAKHEQKSRDGRLFFILTPEYGIQRHKQLQWCAD